MSNKFVELGLRGGGRMVSEIPPIELDGDWIEEHFASVIPALLDEVSPLFQRTKFVVQVVPAIISTMGTYKGRIFPAGGAASFRETVRNGEIVDVSQSQIAISERVLRRAHHYGANSGLTFFGILAHELFEVDEEIQHGVRTMTPLGHPSYRKDPVEAIADGRAIQFLNKVLPAEYRIEEGSVFSLAFQSRDSVLHQFPTDGGT